MYSEFKKDTIEVGRVIKHGIIVIWINRYLLTHLFNSFATLTHQ